MQSYTHIQSSQSMQSSLALLLNNDRTALSNSSGSAFPTVNVEVGMLCYRNDQKKLYTLTQLSPVVWVMTMDFSAPTELGEAPVAQASQLAYQALARRTSGDDGGMILWERPESGTTLGGNIATRIKGNRLQFYDVSSGTKGFFLDFTQAETGIASRIWHSGNDGSGSGLDADMLDGKQSGNASGNIPINNGALNVDLNAQLFDGNRSTVFARLLNPVFTGSPQAPTATLGSNTPQIATTAFVQQSLGTVDLGSRVAKAGDTMTGALINTSGNLTLHGYGGNSNASVIFLNASANRYLHYDGTGYHLPGAVLNVPGMRIAGLTPITQTSATRVHFPFGSYEQVNTTRGNGGAGWGSTNVVWSEGAQSWIRQATYYTNCNCDCNCNCGDCWSCFPEGSMVLMADGSSKEITQVRAGDWVQGLKGPWEVDYLYSSKLGFRDMFRMDDGSITWSSEHIFWSKSDKDGSQWWWGANPDQWRAEANSEDTPGLFDNFSIREGEGHALAHLYAIWKTPRYKSVTRNYDQETRVYLPAPKKGDTDRICFVDGYVVTAFTNEWLCDYTKTSWNEDRASEIKQNFTGSN